MDSPTPNFNFPLSFFQVVLEGISILDVPKLEVQAMEEATSFIHAYGYDSNSEEDLNLIWAFFDDAITFIEKTLTDPQYPRVPDHLRSRDAIKDARRLLLLASRDQKNPDQVWACAILRVMHVLIHISHDPRLKYFEQVQNQILTRLDNYLYVDETDGATYLGKREKQDRIKLLFFKKKDRKDRVREIVKLLHKSFATAEEIYDRIGFRLVTETKIDALRTVELLFSNNIISLPNVRPGRSRNWLIDMDRLKVELNRFQATLQKSIDKEMAEKLIRRLDRRIGIKRVPKKVVNPYSSAHYQAIQFTCRELLKVRNPLYHIYSRLRKQLQEIHGGQQILQDVFPSPVQPFEYVFFPYEIQIMDVKSYADSVFGMSNHDEYRRKQLDAARNRIFGRFSNAPA